MRLGHRPSAIRTAHTPPEVGAGAVGLPAVGLEAGASVTTVGTTLATGEVLGTSLGASLWPLTACKPANKINPAETFMVKRSRCKAKTVRLVQCESSKGKF